jgi:hypothetical protein
MSFYRDHCCITIMLRCRDEEIAKLNKPFPVSVHLMNLVCFAYFHGSSSRNIVCNFHLPTKFHLLEPMELGSAIYNSRPQDTFPLTSQQLSRVEARMRQMKFYKICVVISPCCTARQEVGFKAKCSSVVEVLA